ncbi:MAG: dTMP kinase [Spirochaetota bacterium]
MKLKLPLFIVFEGIDGSGKSTQADLLHVYCKKNDIPSMLFREPTDGPWGKKIRAMLSGEFKTDVKGQLELFLQDREYDVSTNIRPALEEGNLVILDRYYYSTAAYQGGDQYSTREIITMNESCGFPRPDRVYLIDIDPSTALTRVGERNPGREEIFEKKQFLEKVRKNYLDMADETFCVINGNRKQEEIYYDICHDLEQVTGNI